MKNLVERNKQYIKFAQFFVLVCVVLLLPESAMANDVVTDSDAQTGVFDVTRGRLASGFRQTRTIIYILGGIAALGCGVMAFFGRFKWGWFWSILGGLAVVALVVEGVNFAIGEDSSDAFQEGYVDSDILDIDG